VERVVQEDRVPRFQRFPRERLQRGRHGVGHRPEVDGDALGLAHQLAGGIEESRRAVPPVGDVWGVGGPHERGVHLLGQCRAGVADDLEGDRVDAVPGASGRFTAGATAHASTSRTSVPWSSRSPEEPGGTTTVLSEPSTITGPSNVVPTGRFSRS